MTPKKPRKPKFPIQLVPSESESQIAFFERVSLHPKTKHLLIFAIPNGGLRHVATAVRMKREGVKRGVSDIFVAEPIGGFHGLWIEMKKPGEYPSPHQVEFQEAAYKKNYDVAVCYSADEAWDCLANYLAG